MEKIIRFRTATLGCKVNQYETALIRSAFLANGHIEESDARRVDLIVVNTCSVTAESDAKSRKMISSLAKNSPNAEIAVIGCFAASNSRSAAALPNVRWVVGDKRSLPEFLRRLGLQTIPDGITSFSERHRAYVKVQDGCRVGCAYCIIPSVRPYLQSRSVEAVLREVERLADAGYREIVLTGIHLGHYGLDFDASTFGEAPNDLSGFLTARDRTEPAARHTLARLLERLLAERFPVRYRLGSLEAVEAPDELVDLAAENGDRVCPHFHLSMQSASDDVLARMKRRWPSGPYIERCEQIRKKIPFVALTTDVIVGFPGETDAQFDETVEAVRRLRFAKTHIFRFSPRAGTVAAALPNPVSEAEKKRRAGELERVAEEVRARYADTLAKRSVRVLVESVRCENGRNLFAGTCEYYLPVEFFAADAGLGDLTSVKVERAEAGKLYGSY